MKLLESFVIAFSMYSKIPMPRVEWKEENMKYAMCFFPAVGLVSGILCVWIGTWILKSTFGTLFFASVMTLLPVVITGGIHFDGFMDTMDALASYGNREKKLSILKDSHTGAFAVLGMGMYFVWSLALWSEVTLNMLPVIGGGYVISRAFSGFSVVTFPVAAGSSLVKTFQDRAQKKAVRLIAIIWLLAAAVWILKQHRILGAVMLLCAAAIFLFYRQVCRKQFGGVTGDLAGFFLEICELGMLTGTVIASHLL